MQKRELNLYLDWGLLPAALATFSTGLVLQFRFHAGHEVFATEALGVNKLIWVNVHRLSAALVIAGVMTHVAVHWRAFRVHFKNASISRRTRNSRTRKPVDSELIMYTAFLIASLTGLVTWLVLRGSPPLFGPVVIGHVSGARHPWIDTHHVSSLVLLVLVTHHLGHRWRFMRTCQVAGEKGDWGTLENRSNQCNP